MPRSKCEAESQGEEEEVCGHGRAERALRLLAVDACQFNVTTWKKSRRGRVAGRCKPTMSACVGCSSAGETSRKGKIFGGTGDVREKLT